MTDNDALGVLRAFVGALESAGIPYMVVGSFASTAYGAPRTTVDLDLVIDPTTATLDQLLAGLDPDRFYVDADTARDALRRRSMFNVIDLTTAWKVDLIIKKNRAFSVEELGRRRIVQFDDVAAQAATPEDTIIAKLEWAKAGSSERQLRDVAGILGVRGADLDLVYIERWVDELGLRTEWDAARAMIA